jgi:dynein heavy chain 1
LKIKPKIAATMLGIVRDLEASIAKYKEEYALLIRETEAIKIEWNRWSPRLGKA